MAALPRLVLVVLLSLALVACTDHPDPVGDFPPQVIDLGVAEEVDGGEVGAGDAPFDLAAGSSESASLSGIWFGAWEAHTCIEIGMPLANVSQTWFLSRVEQDGPRIKERRRICRMDIGPVLSLQTIIPERVLTSLGELTLDSALESPAAGGSYASGEQVMLWGAALGDDPVAVPLPEELDDPEVADTDSDGQPGATLQVGPGVCEMQVAQRIVTRQWGQLVSSIGIEGTGIEVNEMSVLDATSAFCKAQFPTRPAQGGHNRLRMIRVDGVDGAPDLDADGDGEITCAEALADRHRLLTPAEPNDVYCGAEPEAPAEGEGE